MVFCLCLRSLAVKHAQKKRSPVHVLPPPSQTGNWRLAPTTAAATSYAAGAPRKNERSALLKSARWRGKKKKKGGRERTMLLLCRKTKQREHTQHSSGVGRACTRTVQQHLVLHNVEGGENLLRSSPACVRVCVVHRSSIERAQVEFDNNKSI